MMNNNDDYQRNSTSLQQGRKPYPSKHQDTRYSPSSNYNYGYGHNTGYNGQQQHPRRRADRFKRESLNFNDRISRQNDIIIRLLKEIRDRLPPPPGAGTYENESGMVSENPPVETQEKTETNGSEPQEMLQESPSENESLSPEEDKPASENPGQSE